jgi:hypothetical protein
MQMLGLWFAWDVGQIIIYLSTPTVRSWWIQWVVMAACHCYYWWGWCFDALWAILIRLWLHSLSCHLQGVVLEFSPQSCILQVYPRDLPDTDQVIATFWLRLLCVLEMWLMILEKNCGCRQLWPTTWCWTITIECHLVTLEQSLMKERSVESDLVK